MLNTLKAANAHLLEITRLLSVALEEVSRAQKDNLMAYNEQIKAQLAAFVEAKKLLDSKLLTLAQNNPNAELGELLSDEVQDQLKYLRINLQNLATKNTQYASIIMSLKDFYDDLLSHMLGSDGDYSEHLRGK